MARNVEALGLDCVVEVLRSSRLDECDQCLRALIRACVVEEDAVDTASIDRAAERTETESTRKSLEVDAIELDLGVAAVASRRIL